jgi:hypothetical protein
VIRGVRIRHQVYALLLLFAAAAPCRAAGPDVVELERVRILAAADSFLTLPPLTVTAFPAPESAGGIHDFFSEGDYWWPDPDNPEGPYIRRDGLTNPENFTDHRRAMVRFSIHTGTLASAYRLTGDTRYARHAAAHLHAWFVADATRMNPHMLYAQAIRGRATGRGIGIIDTIHLVEVARAVTLLASAGLLPEEDLRAVRRWFSSYLEWLTTHPYGIEERDARNNHGTCWVLQVAAFAEVTGDSALQDSCRARFRTVLLPDQMSANGSFPRELERTKPYGYSLFTLDAFATICRILSTPADDLWRYELPGGRSMATAMKFMRPYLLDKTSWPFPRDVTYWEHWPVRHPCLLFAAHGLAEQQYLDLWAQLKPAPDVEEVVRNLPVRHPLLWVEDRRLVP